jgi:hypothetical protein
MIQRTVDVEGDYSVDIGYQNVELSGDVTVDTADVLDQLDVDDVLEYYNSDARLDSEAITANLTTSEVLEYLLQEKMRGPHSDINLDYILAELNR